jgi:predicted nucleotidyltransferase
MDARVLGIAEARVALPSIVDKLLSDGSDGVVIGSHRKPEAAIIPYESYLAFKSSPTSSVGLSGVRARAGLVQRLAELSGISAVAVFGSVARGDEHPGSDLDLLVEIVEGTSLFDLAQFEMDMEQLFQRDVDVVTRGSLDAKRDKQVLAEAVPL